MRPPLLPSRATSPDHCAECDGPRDHPPLPLCSECASATWLQRVEWRYQNGEGVVDLHDSDHWTIAYEFHPLHWEIGVSVCFGYGGGGASVCFGPWTLAVRWAR